MNCPLGEVFSNLCFDTRPRIFDSAIFHPQEHQSTYIAAGKEIQNETESSAAIRLGYPDPGQFIEWLKEEPAFAKLRGTPEFGAFLNISAQP